MFWIACGISNNCIFLSTMSYNLLILLGQLSKNVQRKIPSIVLSISLNMCFGCSKELSQWDGSFEYPQHMFWVRNMKIIFSLRILILI